MRQKALITGATSGIGEACARKFAEGGYDIIITGRKTERLDNLKSELEAIGISKQLLSLVKFVRNQLEVRGTKSPNLCRFTKFQYTAH